jgi:hypothetical protein
MTYRWVDARGREAEAEAKGEEGREGREGGEAEGAREWYIRLENLYLNDSYVGYKRIITYHDTDLINTILSYYSLPLELRSRMRIWSSPFRMRRLDSLPHIPEEHVFISVYFH